VNVIGLEVSTSAAKCVLFSAPEGIVDAVEVPFPKSVTDKVTQDAEGMVAAALQALKCLVGRTTREISALGLAGTWHSLLLLDGDGRPLGPISLWSDLSAAPSVAQLRKDRGLVQACYQKTGCVVHATYPVYKYYHLARTSPQKVKQARYVSSQVEYLYQALTGERAVSQLHRFGNRPFQHSLPGLGWGAAGLGRPAPGSAGPAAGSVSLARAESVHRPGGGVEARFAGDGWRRGWSYAPCGQRRYARGDHVLFGGDQRRHALGGGCAVDSRRAVHLVLLPLRR
jgi:hypothetical protein